MGNIQLTHPQPRPPNLRLNSKPRNNQFRRSPFKQVVSPKSPYYNHFSPIRYAQNRSIKKSQAKDIQRSTIIIKSPITKQREFVSSTHQRHRSYQKKQERLTEISSQNKQKCQQIIKKVRNFNDFLLQIKKRLKDNGQNDINVGCDVKKNVKSQRKQLSLSLKLQNQRLQLQKYKKLVERQLSKMHSIQSINIVNHHNGQQILTIQYQNMTDMDKVGQNVERRQNQKQAQSNNNRNDRLRQVKNDKIVIKEGGIQQQLKKSNSGDLGFYHKDKVLWIGKDNTFEDKDHQKVEGDDIGNKLPHHHIFVEHFNSQKQDDSPSLLAQQPLSPPPIPPSSTKTQRLLQAKRLHDSMKKRTQLLQAKLLTQINKNQQQQYKINPNIFLDKDRTIRINQLYTMIYQANRHSIDIQRRINQLLH